MKKFTSLMLLLLCAVTASWAQTLVTDATTISDTKVYTLAPSNTSSTGVVCVPGTDATQLYMSIHADATQDADATNINQRFAFITVQDVTFMYSLGAQKFVADNNAGTSLLVEPTPESIVAFHASTGSAKESYPLVVEVGGDYLCISNDSYWSNYGYVLTNWNDTSDAGCMMAIQEYEPTTEELALIESASTVCEEMISQYEDKTFRIRNKLSNLCLQCVDYTKTSGEGAFQLKTEAEGTSQLFTIEHAGNLKYYIKTVDNQKYVNAASWNFYAGDEATTPFTISLVEGETDVYSLYQSTATYSGYAGNVTTEATDGTYIYNNQPSLTGCTTWIFEEVEIEITPVTVNYSFKYEGVEKYSASCSAVVGGAYPDYNITLPFGVTATAKPAGNIEEGDVTDGVVNVDIALSVDELPFVAAAQNAEDIENWYYMQMHWNNKKYVNTDGTAIKWADTEITDENKDASTWGFVGNIWDGFKVVNYAAFNEENNDNTTLTWNDGSSLGAFDSATEFGLVHTGWGTASAESFCLAISEGTYLNAQGSTVASYSSADAGSTFTLTERPMTLDAELTALIETIEAEGITSGTNPGEYSAASVEALAAALTAAKAVVSVTQDDIDALQAAYDALAINPIEEGMYIIVNAKPAFNNEKVLTAYGVCGWYHTASTPAWTQIDENDPLQYWTIEKDGENYYIKAADGNYITSVSSLGSEPAAATFSWKAAGQYNITIGGGVFHANLHGAGVSTSNIVNYGGDADSPSCWKLVKVAEHPEFTHTLTVGTAGWATLVLGFNATIPTTEGFKAYTIASQETGYVTLADATGVLGANVPVIIEATAGDYEFTYTAEDVTVTESGLQGTLYNKDITVTGAYVLGLINGEVGFGKATTTGKEDGTFTNNANKAYFVPTNSQASTASYSFRFGEGTTGIDEITDNRVQSTEIYDLTGRRVENITAPGIYIVNGVKRIVR